MNIVISPTLDGLASERLRAFATQLACLPAAGPDIRDLTRTEAIVAQAKGRELPVQEVRFDYGDHDGSSSILEPLVGKSGWLTLSSFTVESLDQAEDHLIFGALTDDGVPLDEECTPRLFTLLGKVTGPCLSIAPNAVGESIEQRQTTIRRTISERNARFFEAEAEKLDGWDDDLKLGLEREPRDIDRQLKEVGRAATAAVTLEEKLAGQKQIKALESQRAERHRSLSDAQDQVDQQRDSLIATTEGKLVQHLSLNSLFTIRWNLN
jgi:adenine-specific DNA-methyltransferase